MTANLENSAVATGLEKIGFHSSANAMPKNVQATARLYSFHMLARSCSKFSKTVFNSTGTKNFHMFKLDLEKAEESEIKLPTSVRKFFIEAARKFQKNIYFCFIDYNKAFVWITTNCGKFLKR